MLAISPERRITVAKALTHPIFDEFHDPEDEPVADPLLPYDFNFEKYDLTNDQLMDLLYDEIQLYHDETLLDAYIEDRMLNPEGTVAAKFGLKQAQNWRRMQKREHICSQLSNKKVKKLNVWLRRVSKNQGRVVQYLNIKLWNKSKKMNKENWDNSSYIASKRRVCMCS